MSSPTKGIADNKFVITVAPQKDICPHGNTYDLAMFLILIFQRKNPCTLTLTLQLSPVGEI
jgi:hypothetical protein